MDAAKVDRKSTKGETTGHRSHPLYNTPKYLYITFINIIAGQRTVRANTGSTYNSESGVTERGNRGLRYKILSKVVSKHQCVSKIMGGFKLPA